MTCLWIKWTTGHEVVETKHRAVTQAEPKNVPPGVLLRLKPVLLLLGSNAFATLILALGTFFIARISTPAEFGKYSLAAQIAVSVYPLLTLRYEHALPLLGKRRNSGLLLTGCLLLLPVTTLLLFTLGLIGISLPAISAYIPNDVIDLLPLVALGAFALALSSIFQSAALANGTLKRLAIARVLRAVAMVAMQIGLALSLGASATWLFIGEVSANLIHAVILASAFGLGGVLVTVRRPWPQLWRRLLVLGKRYKEFPLITLPHTFTHSALGLIFASTLGAVYGAAALGQYYLMRKLVFGVLAVFNMAIYQHAVAEAARVQQSELFGVALRALALMGSVAVITASVIALVGPDLFELAVGKKWVDASFMAVAAISLIILEPVTMTMAFLPVFLRIQHIAFAVAIVQGVAGIVAIGISGWLGWDVINAIVASSLAVSIVMLSYILWLLVRAKQAKDSGQVK